MGCRHVRALLGLHVRQMALVCACAPLRQHGLVALVALALAGMVAWWR